MIPLPSNPNMTTTEATITVASLLVSILFYAFVLVVYVVARKTWLNRALAYQKTIWVLILAFVFLPGYSGWFERFPGWIRMSFWIGLMIGSVWVAWEVYRENWPGSFREFLRHIRHSIRCRIRRDCERKP